MRPLSLRISTSGISLNSLIFAKWPQTLGSYGSVFRVHSNPGAVAAHAAIPGMLSLGPDFRMSTKTQPRRHIVKERALMRGLLKEACSLHGTCDESRGICVCPLGRNGSECSQLSTPSCELYPGYVLPCTESVPRPCACVNECEEEMGLLGRHPETFMCLDTRAFARDPGEDEDQTLARVYSSPQVMRTTRHMDSAPLHSEQPPLTGHEPHWHEYVPGAVIRYHLAPTRAKLIPLSHCPSRCSHAGVCMAKGGHPISGTGDAAKPISGSCHCFYGFEGSACDTRASWCPNACNGPSHGACEAGFCRCMPGYFGVDCSLRLPAHTRSPAAGPSHVASRGNGRFGGSNVGGGNTPDEHNNYSGDSYSGSNGHQRATSTRLPRLLWEAEPDAPPQHMKPESQHHPSSSLRTGPASPTFYVYELPPRFNAWQTQYAGSREPLDFGRYLAILWMERLLGSRHRVSDPSAADFFFLPILGRDVYCSRYEAIAWVARNHADLWDKAVASGIPRHVVVLLHDEGVPAYWPRVSQGHAQFAAHGASSDHRGGRDHSSSSSATSSWSSPPPTRAAIAAIRKQLVVLQHMGHARATPSAPLRWWFEVPAFALGADVLIPPEQPGLAKIAEYSPYFGRALPQGGGYSYRPWGEMAFPSSLSGMPMPGGVTTRHARMGRSEWGSGGEGRGGEFAADLGGGALAVQAGGRQHMPAWERPLKLFFSGKAYPVGPRAGDRNVRTRLFQLFFPDGGDTRTHPDALPPGFVLINSSVVDDPHYWDHFATSVFCLSLPGVGGGWGRRGSMAILMGCIPLIIEDERQQPFEEVLPWERFSLSVPFDSMHRLPEIVEDALTRPDKIADMQRELACLAPLLHWTDLLGALPGASWDLAMAAMRARAAAGATTRGSHAAALVAGQGVAVPPWSSPARGRGGYFHGEAYGDRQQHLTGDHNSGQVGESAVGSYDAFSMTMELLRRRVRRLPKVRSVCELTLWAKEWHAGEGGDSKAWGGDRGPEGGSMDASIGDVPVAGTRDTWYTQQRRDASGASAPCLWYRLAELGLHGGRPADQVCQRPKKHMWPPGTAACNGRFPPC
eukprot:jgi/Mesvir1/7443/Mv19222-RA.1